MHNKIIHNKNASEQINKILTPTTVPVYFLGGTLGSLGGLFGKVAGGAKNYAGDVAKHFNTALGQEGETNLWKGFKNSMLGKTTEASKTALDSATGAVSAAKGLTSSTNMGTAALGVLGTGIEMFGGKKADASVATTGDNILGIGSKIAGFLPGPAGAIANLGLGALNMANQYLGGSSHEQGTKDMDLLGYSLDINNNAGKKYSLFGRGARKATNKRTNRMERMNMRKSVSGYDQGINSMLANNSTGTIASNYTNMLTGGMDTRMLAAKKGMKISPAELRNIANKVKRVEKVENKYKEGGLLNKKDKEEVIEEVVEDKMNVIPEGAFHSRLNKYDETIAEHVTRKGIAVITKDGDKITQHAEVEKNEIIFHKEATDTIETLHEKYKKAETKKLKDEIMIECGKYVANQILVNTDDRTGIIETIE